MPASVFGPAAFVLRELARPRPVGPGRIRMCLTAAKLGIKYLFLVRLLKRRLTRERLFGLQIEAGRYSEILLLFMEIFLRQEYRFTPTGPNPRIVDAGGNIGFATLFFKLIWPGARVMTVEPSPASFATLQRNLQLNGFTDVEAKQVAVSGRRGMLNFYVDPDQPTSARSSTMSGRGGREVIRVEAVPLSELIDGPVDFLKLDVEGAEMDVVPELARSGKLQLIREMVIEYHHHVVADEDRLSDMLRVLESSGFGYTIHTPSETPAAARAFQDVMIYAYRKTPVSGSSVKEERPDAEALVVQTTGARAGAEV